MSDFPRVIKRADLGNAVPVDLDSAQFVASAPRIPRKKVVTVEGGPQPEPEARARGIIRRRTAEMSLTAFDLPPIEFTPSHWQTKKKEPNLEHQEKVPDPPTEEEIQAAWEARIEEATVIARDDGFAAGFAEAQAHFQAQLEVVTSSFAADISGLERAWREHAAEAELKMAHLAFELTETILDAPLTETVRTPAEKAIVNAIERATATPIDISLHPDDYMRLQESGAEDQLASMHSGLRWHPTETLDQGDWIVDCPVSCSRRLKKELLADLHTQFLGDQPEIGNGQ